jgi:hypothetical protein
MPPTNEQWSRGYARQALSDLRVRETLVDAKVEKCHRLHFLQMAAEKLCKAYLTTANGRDYVKNSHAYIAHHLPVIATHFYGKLNDNNTIKRWELSAIRRIAREIEVLAPACHEGHSREDNSEYPWMDAQGNVSIPCEYSFPNIDDGNENKDIILLIRLIRTAAESYRQ